MISNQVGGIWNDGGSDCRRSSNDALYALGTYCVRLRDDNSTGTMTTDNLNLTIYDEITIDFSYYPKSMDNSNEDFWLQISTDGGTNFTTIEEWNLNDEFVNDQRYYDQVVISGPFTSNTQFRFRCDASGNSDWVHIDEVDITGCNNGTSSREIAGNNTLYPNQLIKEWNFILYPNPAKNILNVRAENQSTKFSNIFIYDINGRVIKHIDNPADSNIQIDISDFRSGVYFISIHVPHASEVKTKRFIITN